MLANSYSTSAFLTSILEVKYRPVGSNFEMVRPYYCAKCANNTHAPAHSSENYYALKLLFTLF